MTNTYKSSGVDVATAEMLVDTIKSLTKDKNYENVIGGIGGFGSMVALDSTKYTNPVLVSSTDGVGTKILIARDCKIYDTIGIDLVAMCVNDIICHGAKPLFFLDYLASSKLELEISKEIIVGIINGCSQIKIPLVGGETAEMPGLYQKSDFDLAGFVVGIVERDEILPRKNLLSGDLVIGLRSSGFHSNGFSLIRKIFSNSGISYNDNSIFVGKKWHEILLKPTIIYSNVLDHLHNIKAIAHITGGGITENFAPRVIPTNLKFEMEYDETQWPELFKWIKDEGKISYNEMLKTFNCGIGMILVIAEQNYDIVINSFGKDAVKIGKLY